MNSKDNGCIKNPCEFEAKSAVNIYNYSIFFFSQQQEKTRREALEKQIEESKAKGKRKKRKLM